MKTYKLQVEESVDFLKHYINRPPFIGVMTGTGLGESIDALEVKRIFDYSEIPNFPIPTVASHTGRMIFGKACGREIVAMNGRFHLYEGYSPQEVSFPVAY